MKQYKALEKQFRRISAVNGALAVLGWDQSTMMPEGGAKARAEQVATLSVLRHEWITDPRLGDQLNEAAADTKATAGDSPFSSAQRAKSLICRIPLTGPLPASPGHLTRTASSSRWRIAAVIRFTTSPSQEAVYAWC